MAASSPSPPSTVRPEASFCRATSSESSGATPYASRKKAAKTAYGCSPREEHTARRTLTDASRPLGRLLRPEDIAPMVTYLLSDAAQMVTGSVIDFDQTVHGPYGEHVQEVAV